MGSVNERLLGYGGIERIVSLVVPLGCLLFSAVRRISVTPVASSNAMALGAKAPARQTVIIVTVLVLFAWYLALYNRGPTDTLTYTPVS